MRISLFRSRRARTRGVGVVVATVIVATSSLAQRARQPIALDSPQIAGFTSTLAQPVVGMTRAGTDGYRLAAADGGLFSFGDAPFAGSMGGTHLSQPVVGVAGTPTGDGYWMAAADGGVFAFGDGPYLGSMGGARLNQPIVGMAATPSGQGYWLVARDGGVFAFGDGPYLGSMGGTRLNQPIVGMAATPSGQGYWLVARDGGVFSFGDAQFFGSTGGIRLNQPIVGMAPAPAGDGYWLVAADGGVFGFGGVQFLGSAGGARLNRPMVGMVATGTGNGYWLVAADGGIFGFGDAPFLGSMVAARPVNVSRVTMASLYGAGGRGYDISWPQCSKDLPRPGAFAVLGVNNGKAFTHNPCLSELAAWPSKGSVTVYANVNGLPAPGLTTAMEGPAGSCAITDMRCQAYNYGFHNLADAIGYAKDQGVTSKMWWLDVETTNSWSTDKGLNSDVIDGGLDAVALAGAVAGVYSTAYQWASIAGTYAPGVPVWVANGNSDGLAPTKCQIDIAFAAGTPWLVQYAAGGFDGNYAC